MLRRCSTAPTEDLCAGLREVAGVRRQILGARHVHLAAFDLTGHSGVRLRTQLARRDGGHLLGLELARRADGVVDRRDHEVLQHLDIGRVHGGRIDGDADDLLLAGDRRRDDPAAGGPVDDRRLQLGLDAQHLLLHLLGHPLQIRHPHAALLV